MQKLSNLAILLSAVFLGACVSATSPISYGSRSQDYIELIESLGLELGKPNNTVTFVSFDPGEGVYKGVLLGSDEFDNGGPIDAICSGVEIDGGCQWTGLANYIADASLYISLNGQDPKEGTEFTGDFTNFYTLLTGLPKLDGKVDFSGVIKEVTINDKNAVIFSVFDGSGTLKSGTQNIFLVEVEDGAILVGDGGSFAAGAIRNNFTRVADNQILYWDAGIFLARQ